jgi:hypothetical protein
LCLHLPLCVAKRQAAGHVDHQQPRACAVIVIIVSQSHLRAPPRTSDNDVAVAVLCCWDRRLSTDCQRRWRIVCARGPPCRCRAASSASRVCVPPRAPPPPPSMLLSCRVPHSVRHRAGRGALDTHILSAEVAAYLGAQFGCGIEELVADFVRDSVGRLWMLQVTLCTSYYGLPVAALEVVPLVCGSCCCCCCCCCCCGCCFISRSYQ